MCRIKPTPIDTSLIIIKYPNAKWIVLFVCCYSIFTNTYCNNLKPLQQPLLKQYQLSNPKYNVLYTVYGLPNIILPIIGGLLIDKINAEICLIFFIVLELIGQFLFSLGITSFDYKLIIVGRFFYGLGGECVHVATYALIGIYFDASYVAFAMGLRQSMERVGSASNAFFTNMVLRESDCVSCTVWIGFFTLVLNFIFVTVMYILIGYYNYKIFIIRKRQRVHINIPVYSTSLVSFNSFANTPNTASIDHSHSSTIPLSYGTMSYSTRRRSSFRLRDIHDFNSLFWLLNLSCSAIYSCTVCWNNIAQNEFENNFKRTHSQSDALLIVFFLIVGICSPLFGIITDVIGHKAQLIIFSAILLLIAHTFIYCFHHFNESLQVFSIVIVIMLGIAFAVCATVIFPAIAIIVRKRTYGTAYGLITAILNTTLSVVPIIIAILTTTNYKRVEIFLIIMASFSIIIGFLLIFYDQKYGSKLTASPMKWTKREFSASTS